MRVIIGSVQEGTSRTTIVNDLNHGPSPSEVPDSPGKPFSELDISQRIEIGRRDLDRKIESS